MPEAPRHLAQHPPVGPGASGRRQEGTLARDAALRVGDGAVLLAPRRRRQRDVRAGHGVVGGDIVGHDQQLEPRQRGAHGIGARQRHGRVGAHDPQRLDAPVGHCLEHVDGLEALAGDEVRRIPEAAHAVALVGGEAHVRGQHVGEPADLATAHGVGLARQRQRAGARLADAPRRQVAIEDGVDLVGALRRLVDALAVAGDDARGGSEPVVEALDVALVEAGGGGDGPNGRGDGARAPQRGKEALRMRVDELGVDGAVLGQPHQQARPQHAVAAGLQRQLQVDALAGGGAARVDVDDAHAALAACGLDALVEDRMAPGRIGARQHHQVGQLQVVVALRHHVGAEGAAVAGDRGGHAQPRIGVDVRRADEALGQLVGDVIVLRQQLAREVEGDRLGPVRGPHRGQAPGDLVERVGPAGAGAIDDRVQQPRFQPQRLAERRALGAQPAGVGRMLGIAADGGAALAVGRGQHPAADAAIGARGADGGGGGPRCSLSPLSCGERARVRGGRLLRRWRLPPPLTPLKCGERGKMRRHWRIDRHQYTSAW